MSEEQNDNELGHKEAPFSWQKVLTSPFAKAVGIVLVIIILIGGIALAINKFGGNDSLSEILQQYKQQINDSHADIEELNTLLLEERAEREALERTFDTRMREIDERYSAEIEEIRRTRTVRVRELSSRPSELGTRFNERFGMNP